MKVNVRFLNCAVAALLIATPVSADDEELEALFEGLRTASPEAAAQIENRIYMLWSESGSPSMDLLLDRGRTALEAGDTKRAIGHFSALIDHAPDFAEGYNSRATAYFHSGDYGLALQDIRKTLELNPRHFGAMTGLALILEELGTPDDALAVWREIEKIYPSREGLADSVKRLERQVEGETL